MSSFALSSQFTQKNYSWTEWKTVRTAKNLKYQYNDDGIVYTIYGYDGPEVHLCFIFKDIVPYSVIASGYSQAQNDSDKTDFETNFLSNANQPLDTPYVLGNTDNTKIGNLGDRLKVDALVSDSGGSVYSTNTSKLRYVDMNASNGGVNRQTNITTSAFTTVFSYSGTGLMHFFVINLEAKGDWLIKFTVDGEEIFTSAGLNLSDFELNSSYDLDDGNDETILPAIGISYGKHEKFIWNSPSCTPLKFNSSVSISLKRVSSTKKFIAGLSCITKVT